MRANVRFNREIYWNVAESYRTLYEDFRIQAWIGADRSFPRTFKMWGSTAEFGKNSLRCVFDKYLSNCTPVGTYVHMCK